ncbi:hypothetical protein TNCV_5041051 [Trichonephila clavipes]|nr:hypothetical protein TNCV_5041051 [Trichonephila clavipes]
MISPDSNASYNKLSGRLLGCLLDLRTINIILLLKHFLAPGVFSGETDEQQFFCRKHQKPALGDSSMKIWLATPSFEYPLSPVCSSVRPSNITPVRTILWREPVTRCHFHDIEGMVSGYWLSPYVSTSRIEHIPTESRLIV